MARTIDLEDLANYKERKRLEKAKRTAKCAVGVANARERVLYADYRRLKRAKERVEVQAAHARERFQAAAADAKKHPRSKVVQCRVAKLRMRAVELQRAHRAAVRQMNAAIDKWKAFSDGVLTKARQREYRAQQEWLQAPRRVYMARSPKAA
jgi:predicted negative regulator of RcsB-dependent stress response